MNLIRLEGLIIGKFKDLTGLRFGKLVVIERAPNKNKRVYWKCQCDCGNTHVTRSSTLLRGMCRSCGCLNKEINYCKRNNKTYHPNEYDLSGEYGIGYTSKGESFYFDLEDYDKIKDYCWYINSGGYVSTNIPREKKQKKITMHRLIMDLIDGGRDIYVDHIFHNKTDNRKSQLRIVNVQQNTFNHSKFKNNSSEYNGVYWHKKHQKWEVLIGVDGKIKYLGMYKNIEDAIQIRKEAEEKYFGEYKYKECEENLSEI